MLLSNKRPLLALCLCAVICTIACGSKNTPTNAPPSNTANGDLTKGEQPFAAKEPDVYQTEVYYSSGGPSDKYFVARNGNTRRFDTYQNGRVAVTQLIRDNNLYVIDHFRKMYYVEPPSDKGPKAVNPAALAFFQNTQHHEFEEIGREGDNVTYRAKKQPGDSDQNVVLTIDQKTGLMVRQEVKGGEQNQSFTFELKNVKLEAADDLFQIPAGYNQVSKNEFKPPEKKTAGNSSLKPVENLDIKKAHE